MHSVAFMANAADTGAGGVLVAPMGDAGVETETAYCTPRLFSWCRQPRPPTSPATVQQQQAAARKASGTQERLAFLCTSPCFWDALETFPPFTGMASETAPFARRRLRSSLCAVGDHGLGVWALMEAKASGRADVYTQGKQGSDC